MADDYDNTDDLANLSDEELRDRIRIELNSQKSFDDEGLSVRVRNGMVTVSGRVGTESELRILDHVLTDSLGLVDVENQAVVDSLARAESPEAIDEHLAFESEGAGTLLGDMPDQDNPEAAHLARNKRGVDSPGTHDVLEAIEGAEPWIPPEGPTPEGPGEESE